MKNLKKKHAVLVVAAHPDDEVLGCGGTMANYSGNGNNVYVLVLGEGITSRDEKRDMLKRDKEIIKLRAQLKKASEILGVKETFVYDFPDNRFDTVPLLDIIKTVESVVDKVKPDIVYTHHSGDLNIDHQITFKAVLTACRPISADRASNIYSYEVPSSTEWAMDNSKYFMPNYFVNIGSTINNKVRALKAYSWEICDFPHPRSEKAVKTLARNRGISVGIEYAEAFEVIRQVRI